MPLLKRTRFLDILIHRQRYQNFSVWGPQSSQQHHPEQSALYNSQHHPKIVLLKEQHHPLLILYN
ncbi:hypothetical protein PoB_001743500, partial [Plakobranchus ocellatus]